MSQTYKTLLLLNDEAISKALHKFNSKLNIIGTYTDHSLALNSVKLCDLFIVSDRLIDDPIEYLADAKKINPDVSMIYLMSNRHNRMENERIIRYCHGHDVEVIRPGHSTDQIIQSILALCNIETKEDNRTPIITFVGTTPNNGTTTIALNTAILLAKETIGDVGYLELNLRSAKVHRYCHFDEEDKGFDAIENDLRSKTLTERMLERNMMQLDEVPNLYILTGSKQREKAAYFQIDEIHHLLEIAKIRFDIVIVDVHAYWDNAATLQGVVQANRRFIVTSTEITNIEDDFRIWFEKIAFGLTYNLDKDSFDIILNQSYGMLTRRNVTKATKLSVMTEVPLYADVLRQAANLGKPILLSSPQHVFKKNIEPVAKSIIAEFNLPLKEQKKKGVFTSLFKIKRGVVKI